MMVFTAFICRQNGFLAKRLSIKVAKMMSSLVSTIENINNLVIPWYRFVLVLLTSGSLFERSTALFIGVLHGLA